MALTDLLIHFDNSEACPSRIRTAQNLAALFDAHVAGLYISRPITIPVYAEVPLPVEVMDEAKEREKEMAALARDKFEELTSSWESKVSWQAEEGDPASIIIKHARYYDLVVVGQFDPSDESDANRGVADRVVLESGRPVLVIPYIGVEGDIGKRILVAWDGKREAVRAVHDALPFLQRADTVGIVSVDAPRDIDVPSADIAEHLARHDVAVETKKAQTNGMDMGNLLLSTAADYDADMLVMGAYGHSRFREMILGGATSQVLKTMTVPVLMAH